MSLEQALADNTAAITALTAVLRGASVTTAAAQPAVQKPGNDPVPKEEGKKKKAEKVVAPVTPVATTTTAAGPSLKLVTDTVLDFAAENGAKAKDILKSFGVSRITELKPAVYPDVLKAVEAAKAAIAAELLTGNDDVDSLV